MFKIKVENIEKVMSHVDKELYMDVTVHIMQKNPESGEFEFREERKLGYPLGTTRGQLQYDLRNYLKTYVDDLGLDKPDEDQSRTEDEANADKVAEEMTGEEINMEDEPQEEVVQEEEQTNETQ